MPDHEVCGVERLTEWRRRARAVTDRALQLQTLQGQLQNQRDAKIQEIETLGRRQEVLQKVGELFRRLMDRMVDAQVHALEAVVTDGLKSIFYDQDLRFQAEVSQKYNRVNIDFYLSQGDPATGGHRGSPLDSFGGGPSSFSSLVLRIMTLLRMKKRPLLLLDETLAAVSDEYIPGTAQFLHKLAQMSLVDILLVTHKYEFLDHADRAYQGSVLVGPGGERAFTAKVLKGHDENAAGNRDSASSPP